MKDTAIKKFNIQSNIQYVQCKGYTVSRNHPKKRSASSQNMDQDVIMYILPTWRDSIKRQSYRLHFRGDSRCVHLDLWSTGVS